MKIRILVKMTDGSSNWTEDFETEFGYMPEQEDIERYVRATVDSFNYSRSVNEAPRKCVEVISWERIKESSEIQIGARTLSDVEEVRKTLTDMEDDGNVLATGAKLILRWLIEGDDSIWEEFEES